MPTTEDILREYYGRGDPAPAGHPFGLPYYTPPLPPRRGPELRAPKARPGDWGQVEQEATAADKENPTPDPERGQMPDPAKAPDRPAQPSDLLNADLAKHLKEVRPDLSEATIRQQLKDNGE